MHAWTTCHDAGAEGSASDFRAQRRQSFRGACQRLRLLAERESDHSPAEVALTVKARSGYGRDADVRGHPLRECIIRRVAQRGEIGENVIGALWEREDKSRLAERRGEQITP